MATGTGRSAEPFELSGGPRLLVLGSGSMLLADGRSTAGYLCVDRGEATLLDCGPGTLLRLAQAGVPPSRIRRVLLSHFHPDHHADLLGLLFHRRNPSLRDAVPLTVLGPERRLREVLTAWKGLYGTWIDDPALEVVELGLGGFAHGALRGQAFAARHSLPAFCYRLELGDGKVLAYSGDTGLGEGIISCCRDADLALVEMSFEDGCEDEGHLSPAGIRALAAEARPRRLALTHFYPPLSQLVREPGYLERVLGDLDSELIVCEDLMELVP